MNHTFFNTKILLLMQNKNVIWGAAKRGGEMMCMTSDKLIKPSETFMARIRILQSMYF